MLTVCLIWHSGQCRGFHWGWIYGLSRFIHVGKHQLMGERAVSQIIKQYRKHCVFQSDYSVSEQIWKACFLTILFLAAPSPKLSWLCLILLSSRKVKDTDKKVFIAAWDFWVNFQRHCPVLSHHLFICCFVFPSKYICWYHSLNHSV